MKKEITLSNLDWLLGKWKGRHNNNDYIENWVKVNDDFFSGEAFTIEDNKVIFSESIRLHISGDKICYSVKVDHNTSEVQFILSEFDDTKFIFENEKHDFPTRIIYEKKDVNLLYARIEGKDKLGKEIYGEFFLERV